jgi:hypothetical protein
MYISLAVIATAAMLSFTRVAPLRLQPRAPTASEPGIGADRASMPPVLPPGRLTPVPLLAARMPDLRGRWRTGIIEATIYDWAVEHEHVAGVLARLLWGTDTSAVYRESRAHEISERLGDHPRGRVRGMRRLGLGLEVLVEGDQAVEDPQADYEDSERPPGMVAADLEQ